MIIDAKTDLGRIRQTNQDYYVVRNEKVGNFPNLFLVADGVGSNRLSGFASKHCCDFIMDQASRLEESDDNVSNMLKLYKLVNIDLYNRILSNVEYRGMGTTMVMATISDNKLLVGNVGDSRLYHIRDNILQVTRDHSLAEDLVQQNQIKKYSAEYYGYKNQLTKAIGAGKTIQPDFFEVELLTGDYILMCTDGLSNMLTDDEIKEIVFEDITVEEKVKKLVDTANANGGKDNIAVVLIYMDDISEIEEQEEMKIEKDDNYLPHIEVGDDGTKIYNIGGGLNELKVSVDDMVCKEKYNIDIDNNGRSRKKNDDIENKDIDNNIDRKDVE